MASSLEQVGTTRAIHRNHLPAQRFEIAGVELRLAEVGERGSRQGRQVGFVQTEALRSRRKR
jgi:hypothetical protein